MKKYLWVFIVVIIAGLLYANNRKLNKDKANKDTVKIGVILPLTGDFAEPGNDVKNGVLYAFEKRKDKLKNNYEFIFEDYKYEAKTAALVFNKLSTVDNARAVISMWNMASLPIAPLAEKHNLTHISIDSNREMLNYKNNIMHYTTAEHLNQKLVEKLQKENIKNVVLLSHKIAWPENYKKRFYESIKGTNVNVKADLTFNYSEKDYRIALQKTKKLNPDMYVMFLDNPGLEVATKQLREIGINTPITEIECIDYTERLDLFEDVWYYSMAEPKKETVQNYKDRFNKRFKPIAGYGYNAANVLLDVFESKGVDVSTEEIITTINSMGTIDTIFGKSTIEERVIPAPTTLKIVKNGKIEVLGIE